MQLPDDLPFSETFGIFVGISGLDWLTEGNAEPLKAILAAVAAGAVLFAARRIARQRRKD